MVTAVDIDNANTQSELTKLRGTCRTQRTKKAQELTKVRNDLDKAYEDDDNERFVLLQEREGTLETEIAQYRDLITTCSSKIDRILSDSSCQANPQSPGDLSIVAYTDSVNSLATVFADALAKATSNGSSTSTPTKMNDVADFSVSSRTLNDVSMLAIHYRRMEALFLAANFGEKDEDGVFRPHDSIRVPLIEKFLETLSPLTTIVNEAARHIDSPTVDHNWASLKDILLDKFCSAQAVRNEVKKRVAKLTFPGSTSVDQFIDQLRDIRTLHLSTGHKCTTVSDTGACQCFDQNTYFIDSVLKPVPRDLKVQLVRDIISSARQQHPERHHLDWQLRLPFDGSSNTVTILSLLSDVCCADTSVGSVNVPRRSDIRDKVWQASDQRLPTNDNRQRAAHAEAVSWAKSQPYVLLVMGDGVKGANPSTAGFSEANDVKFLTSKAGKPYCLMSFADKNRAVNCVTEYFNDKARFGVVKEFDVNYKRNSRQGFRQSKNGGGSGVHHSSTFADLRDLLPDPHSDVVGVATETTTTTASSEVALLLRLVQGPHSLLVRGIVDSGATCSYLIAPNNFKLPFAIQDLPAPPKVQLADGSVVSISKSVSLRFEIRDLNSNDWFFEKDHDFRFLRVTTTASDDSSSRSSPYCLLGRDLINALGLVCHGTDSAYVSERLVYDYSIPVPFSPALPSTDAIEVVIDCNAAFVTTDSPVSDDPLLIRISADVESSLLQTLDGSVAAGWKPIPLSPGYKTRIRKLSNNDPRDCPSQQYVAELSLPPPQLQRVPTRDYAAAMYAKLPDDLKQQYKLAVDDYVSKGLWEKVDSRITQSDRFHQLPFSSTFLVHGPTRKPRLVIDLRGTNSMLPPTTASMSKLWEAICGLRILSPSTLAVADIRSAFYSIRLSSESNVPFFKIRTAIGDFITARVGFGCSPGPGSLINTLGGLVQDYRTGNISLPGWLIDFIDDLILAGLGLFVVSNLARLLWLLQLVAFCAQQKKLGIICAPSEVTSVKKCLHDHGLKLPISDSISIFNTSFSYDGELRSGIPKIVLTVDCKRIGRVQKALSYLEHGAALSLRLTKKTYFCLAGVVAFDSSRLHGEMRLLGDVIRAFVGSRFVSTPWDKVCDLHSMQSLDQACFTEIVNWGLHLCRQECVPCKHTSLVYDYPAGTDPLVISLTAFCDASLYGGGIVICRNFHGNDEAVSHNSEIILTDCLRFSRTQANYSANRRELLVCLQTLRVLSSLVEYLHSVATKQSRDLNVDISLRCDNRSSISWMNDPSAVIRLKSSRALEKRSIIRLVECVVQEITRIRSFGGTISVSHVQGSVNMLADSASRCLDRVVPDSGGLSMGALLLKRGEGEGIKVADIYNSVNKNEVEAVGQDCDDSCCALIDRCPVDSSCDLCSLLQHPSTPLIGHASEHHHDCCRVLEDAYDRPSVATDSLCIARDLAVHPVDIYGVLDTINCVFELRDSLHQVKSSDVSPHCQPLVEIISTYSYDLDDVLWRVRLLRAILAALKENHDDPDAAQLTMDCSDHWGYANIRAASHSAQLHMMKNFPVKSVIGNNSPQHGGPVQLSVDVEAADIFVYRSGISDGSVILLPYIPREATFFRQKIVLDAHRVNAHPGVPGTVGFVRDFYLPAIIGLTRSVINNCICCRISNASRGWHTAPGAGDIDSIARYGPYHHVTIDVVSLGEKTHALSCQCRLTRHVIWQHIPDETTQSILDALCRAQVRAGPFRVIFCDRASYFRSSVFKDQVARRLGATVRLLSRHAPWEGGHERHHGVMCSLLRNSLRHCSGRLQPLSDQQRQDLFDRICLVHSNLPLGSYLWLDGAQLPVCPELLCNGRLRSLNMTTMMFCNNVLPYRAAQAAQRSFLSEGWALIKRRNSAVRPSTTVAPDSFDPGRTVLVYCPAPRKLAKNFTVAHVSQKISRNRVEVVLPTGVKSVENMYNVLPIGRHPED